MDPIRHCFTEQNRALMKRLTAAGFTIDQARRFLQEAAVGLYLASRTTSEFQTIACLFTRSRYQMPRNIDLDAIAQHAGMAPERVTRGLHVIAPLLLQCYAQTVNDRASVMTCADTRLHRSASQ